MSINLNANTQKLYDRDFVEWCEVTVSQLKAKKFESLDIDNLIEEIAGLANGDKRELKNRLTVLLAHILKRVYLDSPQNFRGWELTIREQRRQIQNILTDSPSLQSYLEDILETVYQDALEDVCFEYQQTEFHDFGELDLGFNNLLFKKYWEAE
ncbi:MAG: DUF29 domain-containing protein [Spirulinaceae cyanobacterium]